MLLPSHAVIISSESPQAELPHSQNTQQFLKCQPQAMNSLFSDCHVTNAQVFMGNNSAGSDGTSLFRSSFCHFFTD